MDALGRFLEHSKKLQSHSALHCATLTHFFVLSSLPHASITRWTHATYDPFLKLPMFSIAIYAIYTSNNSILNSFPFNII